MTTREQELEDKVRQLEAEVRRLRDEIQAIEMGYPRPTPYENETTLRADHFRISHAHTYTSRD